MFLLGIKGFCNFSMIKKKLNRFEYIRLTKTNKMFFAEIFNKDYQKLKVGDKVLCYYENEEIEAYVTKLIYVFPEKNIIDNLFFDDDKYGKLHIYLSLDYKEEDQSYYINEYLEYKKLLEESNRVNFNILSKVVPTNIERTKVVMPCKIINPLLMDNLISNMFNYCLVALIILLCIIILLLADYFMLNLGISIMLSSFMIVLLLPKILSEISKKYEIISNINITNITKNPRATSF